MIDKRLAETVEKYDNSLDPDGVLQRMLETYTELVEKGYTRPRGYTLQSFEDKHKENAKFRITVIRRCNAHC